ncbi:MAG: rubredoxin, partial [Plesiomonas shigelloides]
GIVWRDNPVQIIEQYLRWADQYQEDKITLFYDSMSNNTRMMADAIAQGISERDPRVAVKIFNVSRHDKNEILAQVFCSKGILVGSSTMNNVMMPKIAGMLEEITGLRFRSKKAAAFGSYGWNGGAVDRIHARLTDAGFMTCESMKAKWKPDSDTLQLCRDYGRKLAEEWALTPLPEPAAINVQTTTAMAQVEGEAVSTIADAASPQISALRPACQSSANGVLSGRKMICTVCQWVYDPAVGEPNQDIAPGTEWDAVPDDFLCPDCGLGKDVFDPLQD